MCTINFFFWGGVGKSKGFDTSKTLPPTNYLCLCSPHLSGCLRENSLMTQHHHPTSNIFTVTLNHPPPPNKNFDPRRACFHPGLNIGLPSMPDHFHKSGVFINPVFHAGSCAYKIETFAFRKRTKTETATCLLVMIFTKGPGPQSFKSARVSQQPSALQIKD